MAKKNCWEIKNCGREPGGAKVAELGICPATQAPGLDGVHGGRAGGRSCWVIDGTLCGGKKQGGFAAKLGNCIKCEFYRAVQKDEGGGFRTSKVLMDMMTGTTHDG